MYLSPHLTIPNHFKSHNVTVSSCPLSQHYFNMSKRTSSENVMTSTKRPKEQLTEQEVHSERMSFLEKLRQQNVQVAFLSKDLEYRQGQQAAAETARDQPAVMYYKETIKSIEDNLLLCRNNQVHFQTLVDKTENELKRRKEEEEEEEVKRQDEKKRQEIIERRDQEKRKRAEERQELKSQGIHSKTPNIPQTPTRAVFNIPYEANTMSLSPAFTLPHLPSTEESTENGVDLQHDDDDESIKAVDSCDESSDDEDENVNVKGNKRIEEGLFKLMQRVDFLFSERQQEKQQKKEEEKRVKDQQSTSSSGKGKKLPTQTQSLQTLIDLQRQHHIEHMEIIASNQKVAMEMISSMMKEMIEAMKKQ